MITQQPVMHSILQRAFGCRDRLLFEAIVPTKEGSSLTSNQSLMILYYQKSKAVSMWQMMYCHSYDILWYHVIYCYKWVRENKPMVVFWRETSLLVVAE